MGGHGPAPVALLPLSSCQKPYHYGSGMRLEVIHVPLPLLSTAEVSGYTGPKPSRAHGASKIDQDPRFQKESPKFSYLQMNPLVEKEE